MASTNIYTLLALCLVFVACEASVIKGLGTAGQIEIPGIPSIQASEPPKEVSNPSFSQTTSTNPAASGTGVSVHSAENEPGPTDSLPSKPEGSGLLAATSPKEEMPGVTAFPVLARIPGYDERCNMQATTAKTKCKSKPGGKKRHRRWYLDPSSKKCLPSCEKKAPFRYKIHCDAICRTEKVCHLAPTGFPCVARTLHPVFIYNRNRKKCVRAEDCDYYGNKFVTLRECQNTCEKGGLQQTQQLVTSTTATSSASSNRIPTFVPPSNAVLTPSFPGASNGQVITGNIAATGGMQQTAGGSEAGYRASLPTQTSVSSPGQQPSQTPTAILPGQGVEVPQEVTGGKEQQSSSGSSRSSQVSTQAPNLVSSMREPPTELPGLPGHPGIRILGEKLSIGATSIPQTTSQDASSSSPLRRGQGPSGSGIPVSPELEIVAAGTGPRRNQVTTESSPSDTSGESLSLDLGLGGPRGPLNTGATSISGNLRRTSFGLPTSFGPLPQQFGASVSPELEIVAVRTGRMPRPPSGQRPNRRRTGTSHPGISRKPGSSGLGGAPPRVSLPSGEAGNQPGRTATLPTIPGELPGAGLLAGQRTPSSTNSAAAAPGLGVLGARASRGPTLSPGTNAQMPGSTVVPGIPHPGLSFPGLSRPQIIGPARIPGITTGASASHPSNVPDNLDLGLGTVGVSSHTGSTSPSMTNTLASGLTESMLTVKRGQPGGSLPAVPPLPGKIAVPIETGTSGPQAPSLPVHPGAPVVQKPGLPLTPSLIQNILQERPKTKDIGASKKRPVKTGTKGLQAPSLPVIPVAPTLEKPSLPPSPPLKQNPLQQPPTTQKGGKSKEGPVQTVPSGPQVSSLPVNPAAPVLLKPSLPAAPPLNQIPIQKRPTSQKIGASNGRPVKIGINGLQTPSLPVIPVLPTLERPTVPPSPPLKQNPLQQQPTTQKGGTSKEGPLQTVTSGPQVPSLPVNAVAPVLPKPSLPAAPSLNQVSVQKRPTSQKIESQIITGSQAISQGSLNDKRLVKRIHKGGNEGIQIPVSEQELPLPFGPLNEPPLKGFSLTTLPKVAATAKLPGLLKIKTVQK